MTLRNTGLKLIIAFVVVILAVLVFNINQVSAYSVENIKAGNEVESGLIDNIYQETMQGVTYGKYMLNFNAQKLIKLLDNDSKLDKLLQKDNYIYDNLYFKLSDNATSASVTYGSGETKNLEIVTLDGVQYAKCPIGIIRKSDNVYYLGYLVCEGFGKFGNDTLSGTIEMKNNNDSIEKIEFITELNEEEENANGATLSVSGSSTILSGGAGTWYIAGLWFDRNDIAKSEKCYLQFETSVSVGDSITIEPFGTFSFVKKENRGSYYDYIYELPVSDKSIFNKSYKGRILIPEYNILNFYSLSFNGDLIEETKPTEVTNTDTTTKIKLDTTTEVVPAGTTLVAEKVTSGTSYNTVVKAVEKDVSKFEMYDISLMNNNAKIQPNGKVKVSIPVPSGFEASKIVVYRVADDGTKTKLDANVKDGYVVFETDHFSNYVVAEKATSTENTNTDTTETKTENKNTDRELDNTPKTGEETNVISVVATIVSVISALGLAVIKKF